MQTTRKPNESGELWIDDGVIHYDSEHCGHWTCPVADIVLIGEYTNDHGPYLDDWFFVFMVAGQNWFEASMYAKETDTFRDDLRKQIGADVITGLANSTDFKSRVLWPEHLAGNPLFDFRKVEGATLARRIKLAILPEMQFCLATEVEKYLKGLPNQALHATSEPAPGPISSSHDD